MHHFRSFVGIRDSKNFHLAQSKPSTLVIDYSFLSSLFFFFLKVVSLRNRTAARRGPGYHVRVLSRSSLTTNVFWPFTKRYS